MSEILKLKYKVGQIEFEAEGPAEAVEQQRVNFMSAVLPAAVDAMVRTQSIVEAKPCIDAGNDTPLLESKGAITDNNPVPLEKSDLLRTSLSSYIKKYGDINEQDFTLFAAYFYEIKNGTKVFSIDDVKKYYPEARRPLPKNPSMSLYALAQKGYIMDADSPDGDDKSGKWYMISDEGIAYIENYVPKEDKGEKKKTHRKQNKVVANPSSYSKITADDLNLKNYPALKSLSSPKDQVILAMYIVTNEGKGEWFTVDDVIYLLVNIYEIPANKDMVNGVFKRNKSMFSSEQDINNKKAYRRKLLSGAKDFAKELIVQNK